MKMRVRFALISSLSISILLYLARNPFSNSVPLIIFNIAGWLKLPGDLLVYFLFGLLSPQKAWQILHGVHPYFLINYLFIFVFYFLLFYILLNIFKFHPEQIREGTN